MTTLVVYESMYGNTREIAEHVAQGLRDRGEVRVVAVGDVTAADVASAELVVMGGPTHVHGMSSRRTRSAAVAAASSSSLPLEPHADGMGVRDLLAGCGHVGGTPAAVFDTRMSGRKALTGSAARGISRRMRRRGFKLVAPPESFVVDRHNHLLPHEDTRASVWGSFIARSARHG
jgi:hypothetical protein